MPVPFSPARPLAVILSLGGGSLAVAAGTKPAPAAVEKPFDPAKVDTFSGAFLAALTADTDYDSRPPSRSTARRCPSIRPYGSQGTAVVVALSRGHFDEGGGAAEEMKHDPAMERLTTVPLGIDAIRKGRFDQAETILKYEGPNDLTGWSARSF